MRGLKDSQIQAVVAVLMEGAEHVTDIVRLTGLGSGTVHAILARLERQRIAGSEWEAGDAELLGRPLRRRYWLA